MEISKIFSILWAYSVNLGMNERITRLFSCCLDNRVIVIDTNFKSFHRQLKNLVPKCNSDRWYSDRFKKEPEFDQVIDGHTYHFQQLL